MALLKENGSLDIERINKLPIDEYTKEIQGFTDSQLEEYRSMINKQPINEAQEPVRPIIVDYTIEEDIERNGLVNADEFFNKIREKYGI